jgi:hypothetical protein
MADGVSTASTAAEAKRPSIRTAETIKLQPVSNTSEEKDAKSPRFSNAQNPFARRESLDLDEVYERVQVDIDPQSFL